MRMHWLSGCVVAVALALVGCNGSNGPEPEVVDDTRLPESTDINLADWLGKPRSELAERGKDKLDYLRQHQQAHRTGRTPVELLPDLRPAVTPPIFRNAEYSKKLGISLPPYHAEDAKDSALAWHFARFGDSEAAAKVAPPGEKDVEQLRYERNYPVEWTRLVALQLFDAEMKLARGEKEGAAELIHLHRQLEKVLDEKAKAGPLGAALLPLGRRALTLAVPAYREAPFKMNLMADDIEAALKEWKDIPTPQPAVVIGADKKNVAPLFRSPQQGRIFAASGNDATRAVDLFALPIPNEDVNGIVAFIDSRDRLVEVLIYYHSDMRTNYPQPVQLAQHLVDHGGLGTDTIEANGVLRQMFLAGTQAYQVSIFNKVSSGSAPTSAIIRVGDFKGAMAEASLPATARDLGAISLDRSFDQNRLLLDPSVKPGALVETTRAASLERVKQPIREPKPVSIALTKEADADLVASLALRWSAEVNGDAVAKLLVPLWAAYGGCRIDGLADSKNDCVAFTWENETTRFTFRLPISQSDSPELVAADRRGTDAIAQRQEVVAVADQGQREERLKAGTEQKRLERFLYEPGIKLGMPKAEALLRLPKSKDIRQTSIADGVSLFFLSPPDANAPYSPLQYWVRFGPNERVAEIRVRYLETATKATKAKPSLSDWLRRSPNGEPESLHSKWAGLWSELPKRGTASLSRWRDDVTLMTYERDAGGSEVILRDCPLEHANGVPLPPLEYCSRGVENCRLGDARAGVLKYWPGNPVTTADGGLVLGQVSTSPYDLVLVWFENDKVSRVVARHRVKEPLKNTDVKRVLHEAWSRDLDSLGVIRRQDGPSGQLREAYGWHDDRTRVRIFGQDTEDGPRLLTEWREWPVAIKTVAKP